MSFSVFNLFQAALYVAKDVYYSCDAWNVADVPGWIVSLS